jgi:hypothetical protein
MRAESLADLVRLAARLGGAPPGPVSPEPT